MAKIRYIPIAVTGVANQEVLDIGVESTEAEPKRVIGVYLTLSGYAGNRIVGYHETTRQLEIYDYCIDTFADTGTTSTLYSTTKVNYIEIDRELPVGERYRIGIICGATPKNLYGAYKIEITA